MEKESGLAFKVQLPLITPVETFLLCLSQTDTTSSNVAQYNFVVRMFDGNQTSTSFGIF